MAGVYVHIPFCQSRCGYCDFFSTTQLERRADYVSAVLKEMQQRQDYLPSRAIQTVYLGGGTPSLLNDTQLGRLLMGLKEQFALLPNAEVTLEANPGDIREEVLRTWRSLGVNRLSIGVQSFQDPLLSLIGRRHTAEEARRAIRMAHEAGVDNCSLDLIYGLPGETMADWQDDVKQALELHPTHISAYCLSYEEGTRFAKMRENGLISELNEEVLLEMYDYLCSTLKMNGYEHYEVSNFALPNRHSQHNSSYWQDIPYLGLGAGAHSYDGKSRQWNISSLDEYIQALERGEMYFEREELTDVDRTNEQIMLSLRTSRGLDVGNLSENVRARVQVDADAFVCDGYLRKEGERYVATLEGIHVLNRIIEKLML